MKLWFSKLDTRVASLTPALLLTLLASFAVADAAAAADLQTSINAALGSTIVKTLVTGACLAMGVLEAINIWKAAFGGGGDGLWKNVLTLLGWVIFAAYWIDLVKLLMSAFSFS